MLAKTETTGLVIAAKVSNEKRKEVKREENICSTFLPLAVLAIMFAFHKVIQCTE